MLAADPGTATAVARHRGRGFRRLLVALVLAVVVLGAGFLWFVGRVPIAEAEPAQNADGIVALTGSAFRIADALDLLAAGHGKRLLITGVNPITRPVEISRTARNDGSVIWL